MAAARVGQKYRPKMAKVPMKMGLDTLEDLASMDRFTDELRERFGSENGHDESQDGELQDDYGRLRRRRRAAETCWTSTAATAPTTSLRTKRRTSRRASLPKRASLRTARTGSQMAAEFITLREANAIAKRMDIEDVPYWQVETALQHAVRALKRHRDLYFAYVQPFSPGRAG